MPPTNAWEPEAALCSNGLGAALRKALAASQGRQAAVFLALVIAYGFIGAAVFSALERPAALERQNSAEALLAQFLDRFQCVDSANLASLLRNLTDLVQDLTSLLPNSTLSINNRWDFSSSLYFSTTVFTTIGYGNLAPVTPLGRAFCCLYALIGIPLLAVLLTLMADQLKQLGQWAMQRPCFGGKARLARASICGLYVSVGTLLYFVVPSLAFMSLEGWGFGTGVYFCLTSLTTIGFGDYIPAQKTDSIPYKFMLSIWTLTGLVYASGLVSGVQLLMQLGAESIANISAEDEKIGDEDSMPETAMRPTPKADHQPATKEAEQPIDSSTIVEYVECLEEPRPGGVTDSC